MSKENADLKKLSISLEANQKAEKKRTDQIKQVEKIKASENLLNKQVSDAKKILKIVKKDSKLNAESMAKTDDLLKKYLLSLKIKKKIIKRLMKRLKNITKKKQKGHLKEKKSLIK